MLRERVWKYAPGLVMLAFLPGNEVRNNSRELEPNNLRPFFLLEGDWLVLDDSFLEKLGPRAFERPGFLVRMVQRFRVLELVDQARVAAIALEARVPVVELGPPLARFAAVHHTYLHGFPPDGLGNGHWNETGHRLAGEILAQRICASWSRPPTPR